MSNSLSKIHESSRYSANSLDVNRIIYPYDVNSTLVEGQKYEFFTKTCKYQTALLEEENSVVSRIVLFIFSYLFPKTPLADEDHLKKLTTLSREIRAAKKGKRLVDDLETVSTENLRLLSEVSPQKDELLRRPSNSHIRFEKNSEDFSPKEKKQQATTLAVDNLAKAQATSNIHGAKKIGHIAISAVVSGVALITLYRSLYSKK